MITRTKHLKQRVLESLGIVRQEAAHAYLELIITLPFLLLAGFGGFELTRFIGASQAAGTLSRELASSAYRCAAEQNTLVDCLKERRADIEQFATGVFPGASTRVSIYQFVGDRSQCDDETPNSAVPIVGEAALVGTFGAEEFPSRIRLSEQDQSSGTVGGGNDLAWSLCMNGFAVIGEARIVYSPAITFIHGFSQKEFYDATVL